MAHKMASIYGVKMCVELLMDVTVYLISVNECVLISHRRTYVAVMWLCVIVPILPFLCGVLRRCCVRWVF